MTIYESIKKSIAFIEDNLSNDIGVSDVANSVSFSQFYFSREFSKYTHISIYDYIIRRKISESYKYLFNNRPKIIDLAFLYSFKSHEVYSRAFRKIFGENPSEVTIYKPFAVYEAIDENYLLFLKNLKIELLDYCIKECVFEVDSASDLDNEGSFLFLLSKEHLLSCNGTIKGKLESKMNWQTSSFVLNKSNKALSFQLCSLKHKLRIFHNNTKHSLRYFLDNIYDRNEIGSNYILILKENDYIDFYIPSTQDIQDELVDQFTCHE